ncbi:MAG: hypothetical protein ACPLXC_03335, partial [Candidatus Pacearchaeota archaeon]
KQQIKMMTTDGWNAYEKTIKKVFGYNLKEGMYNVFHNKVVVSEKDEVFNYPIERLHNSVRHRTKTFRGFHGYSYGFLMDLMDSLSKLFPGQYLDMFGKGYGGSQGQNEIVITGPFNLEQGKPYFISATQDWNRWTWVGKVPEHVRFELKHHDLPQTSYNYIVLPLDTRIKKEWEIIEQEGSKKIIKDNIKLDKE